jgi:hypothetical protein
VLLDLAPLRTGAPPAARTLGVRGCAKHQTPQRRTRRERVRHRCAPAHRCAPGREDAGGKRTRKAPDPAKEDSTGKGAPPVRASASVRPRPRGRRG